MAVHTRVPEWRAYIVNNLGHGLLMARQAMSDQDYEGRLGRAE